MGAAQYFPQIIETQQLNGLSTLEIQGESKSAPKQAIIGKGKTIYTKDATGLQVSQNDFESQIPKSTLRPNEPSQNQNYIVQGMTHKKSQHHNDDNVVPPIIASFPLFDPPEATGTDTVEINQLTQLPYCSCLIESGLDLNNTCKCLSLQEQLPTEMEKAQQGKHGKYLGMQVNKYTGLSSVIVNGIQKTYEVPNEGGGVIKTPINCQNIAIPVYDPSKGTVAISPDVDVQSFKIIRKKEIDETNGSTIKYDLQTCFGQGLQQRCFSSFQYSQVFPSGTTVQDIKDNAYKLVVAQGLNPLNTSECGIALKQ